MKGVCDIWGNNVMVCTHNLILGYVLCVNTRVSKLISASHLGPYILMPGWLCMCVTVMH
jgi:hypothetical protein